jgi:thymidylate kinase
MKIGIIGTHGVGKTNTVLFLASYLTRFGPTEIVNEVARPLLERGMPINKETTFEAQYSIQLSQRIEELVAEEKLRKEKAKYIVCDRTVIDNYVYAENKYPLQSVEELHEPMMRWLETHPYNKIFRIPLWNADQKIVADKVRSEDKEFQLEIDRKLTNTLDTLKVYKLGNRVENIPPEFYKMPYVEQVASFARYFENIFGYEKDFEISRNEKNSQITKKDKDLQAPYTGTKFPFS